MDFPRPEQLSDQPASNVADPRRITPPVARPVVVDDLPEIELHVCPSCASELVYPIEWAPADMCHWRVELRCPECEWHQVGLYEQAVLDRFDDILDAGTEDLVADLQQLQRSNIECEVKRLGTALTSDLLLPEDF